MRSLEAMLAIAICLATALQARAQSFVDIARADPSVVYFYIKRSFERDRDPQDTGAITETKLQGCVVGGAIPERRFDDLGNKLLLGLADHADAVLKMQEALQGYPDSVWKSDLEVFEKAQIARIAAGEKAERATMLIRESLARKAKRFRRLHPNLPKVLNEPENCLPGDEKYKVKIATEPQAHRIQYVSMRVFEYCEEKVSDIELREKCNMWIDAGNLIHRMIGTYKVRVFWSEDNKSELFNVPLDGVEKSSDGIVHYSIKKPGGR